MALLGKEAVQKSEVISEQSLMDDQLQHPILVRVFLGDLSVRVHSDNSRTRKLLSHINTLGSLGLGFGHSAWPDWSRSISVLLTWV